MSAIGNALQSVQAANQLDRQTRERATRVGPRPMHSVTAANTTAADDEDGDDEDDGIVAGGGDGDENEDEEEAPRYMPPPPRPSQGRYRT